MELLGLRIGLGIVLAIIATAVYSIYHKSKYGTIDSKTNVKVFLYGVFYGVFTVEVMFAACILAIPFLLHLGFSKVSNKELCILYISKVLPITTVIFGIIGHSGNYLHNTGAL
ncbi:hypothetical protein [Campylobacter fetus]|uniref:hypothetical protein n=1 Tax=Campylobacter fetus TaxID=196 RepID=UPI00138DED17|nr:hypothetical protein [Campylobacter fetus]